MMEARKAIAGIKQVVNGTADEDEDENLEIPF
jgi:hypothetical protein